MYKLQSTEDYMVGGMHMQCRGWPLLHSTRCWQLMVQANNKVQIKKNGSLYKRCREHSSSL